ncbi:MAG TPA: hypothetical protein PK624_13320, partial [Spirochaetota bacterium]|nr:hypothetical protein [Spirochaetota bacterium]HPK57434.1 hypothetical protein [Spirochaetota bacterium]
DGDIITLQKTFGRILTPGLSPLIKICPQAGRAAKASISPSVGISHKAMPYESFFLHGSCNNFKGHSMPFIRFSHGVM